MDYKDIFNTEEARGNFIKGCICLAKVDGVISPEERQYFMAAACSMGVSDEQMEEIRHCMDSHEDIHVQFNTFVEKVLFFREAIQLCAVDGEYTEPEKTMIKTMANTLSVPDSIIREIEDWVEEGMIWKKHGDNLVEKYMEVKK